MNAFKEYQRRGGGQLDSAAKALRMRLDAINSNGSIEHYGRGGLSVDTRKIAEEMAGSGLTSASPPGDRGVQSHPSEGPPPATSIIAMPAITPEELTVRIARWNEYALAIERGVPGAIKVIHDHRWRAEPFWRSVRLAFDLDHLVRIKGSDSTGRAWATVEVWPRSQPDRKVVTDAICDRKEKGKSDTSEDSLQAIAVTRARNRATRELVGFGEPSAEEVE